MNIQTYDFKTDNMKEATQEDFDRYVKGATRLQILLNIIGQISKLNVVTEWDVVRQIEKLLTNNNN